MTPAQHAPGQHLPSCSSPENCSEYAAVLSMTPTEHCAWITQDRARLRTAAARPRQFRVSQQENFTAPDGYALALAARRLAEATPESRFAEQYAAQRTAANQAEYTAAVQRMARPPASRLTAAELARYAPPNGYQLALDKIKEAR